MPRNCTFADAGDMSDPLNTRDFRARQRISAGYSQVGSRCAEIPSVDTISFQPKGVDENEDRVATHSWRVHDQHWMFLGVFDGKDERMQRFDS